MRRNSTPALTAVRPTLTAGEAETAGEEAEAAAVEDAALEAYAEAEIATGLTVGAEAGGEVALAA